MVVADRVGRSDLCHVGDSGRRNGNAEERPLSPGRTARADDCAPLHGAGDQLCDRKDDLAAAAGSRRSAGAATPQEYVRVGNAGHRRQTRVCGVRQCRHLRMDFDGALVWSKPIGRRRHAQWLGHRIITGHSRWPSLLRQRQRRRIVADGHRRRDRKHDLARRAAEGGTNWSTPLVWAHAGRTEIVTNGTSAIRSYGVDGALLWQLGPILDARDPDALRQRRSAVVSSGYVGDQAPRLRRPPWRQR